MVKNWLKQYYSKQEVWTLFLISAFPIHVWTYILFFWDFSWIEERSGTWNAIGVGAYALVIALIESVFVLLVALVLGFFYTKNLVAERAYQCVDHNYLSNFYLGNSWAVIFY